MAVIFSALIVGLVSCGQEETKEEVQNNILDQVIQDDNLNNVVKQGLNEVNNQLKDSTSVLNKAIDTIQTKLDENPGEIEDKIQEGLDALNKSF
jgi:Na+-translocating ferredoxin:NAD+ oxidoreductase RnfG subunit